ncbi:hypothetical protein NQZ68_013907 [Dissostichus eleginoides]|nr:hypothetical protein NQZ68_013907 [Dissostichus eleginoides]
MLRVVSVGVSVASVLAVALIDRPEHRGAVGDEESFRRHFSSSPPVAHPGVTRFSVAGGGRQKVSGGSQRSQEVTDDKYAHESTERNA